MLLKLISIVRIKTLEFRKGTQQVHTCNQIHQERKSLGLTNHHQFGNEFNPNQIQSFETMNSANNYNKEN